MSSKYTENRWSKVKHHIVGIKLDNLIAQSKPISSKNSFHFKESTDSNFKL